MSERDHEPSDFEMSDAFFEEQNEFVDYLARNGNDETGFEARPFCNECATGKVVRNTKTGNYDIPCPKCQTKK